MFLAVLAIALLTKIMNKKILLVLGVVLLIAAATFVFIRIKNNKYRQNYPQGSVPVSSGEISVPSDVPSGYRDLYVEKIKWLDEKLIEWKPAEYKPMDFGVYHVYASDNIFVRSNADFDIKMLDSIEEVNPDTVLLYIRPGAYYSQKERYDLFIDRIRKDGKKLFIGARFDDIKMNFGSYSEALNDYTKNIIAAIKPDYFGIVIEPKTMESMYNFEASDEDWKGLVERISELSKQLSPNTKTAAAGHKEELNFLRIVSDIKDLDIVGFNIYGMEGIYPEYSGSLGKGDVVGDAVDFANSKGKETWMVETWTSAMINDQQRAMSIKEFMKPIDAKWIRLMVYYAQKHNMSAIVPFYTGKFIYYGSDQNELVSALNSKQRTPAFESYKSVIEEIRNKKQSETKDEANSIVNINKDESMPDSSKDGNHWIREGAIYEVNIANFSTKKTYSELTSLIPKLKSLGIKTIYLLPIWNSIETQKNKTSGYSLINSELNPNYGTEKELKQLIDTVHANNIKILFDLVISYRPDTSVEYKNHPEMFLHNKKDGSIYRWRWGYSTDQTSPEFISRISDMAEYYVKTFDINGWRIDAPQINIKEGDEGNLLLGNGKPIPPDYGAKNLLKEVKRKITAIKPDAILYAEMPGPLCERAPETCDTAYDEYAEASYNWYFSGWLNYPTKLPIGSITYKNGFLDKIVNNKATSRDLVDYMIKENIKNNRIRSHFSENHDTQRAQSAYPKQNKALLVIISTIPGVPMIQAGQEIGSTKKQVVDLSGYNTNSDIWQFYKKVLSVRNSNNTLKYGDIKNVWKSGDNIYAYSRTYENETAVVVINFNGKQAESVLDIPFDKGTQLTNELSGEIFNVGDPANFNISVPAYDSRILTIKR